MLSKYLETVKTRSVAQVTNQDYKMTYSALESTLFPYSMGLCSDAFVSGLLITDGNEQRKHFSLRRFIA